MACPWLEPRPTREQRPSAVVLYRLDECPGQPAHVLEYTRLLESPLTPAPGSSPGQALSREGRGSFLCIRLPALRAIVLSR
jgi:hypothetical protein